MVSVTSSKYFTSQDLARLDLHKVPEHVAIIMDGNRRWATQHTQEVSKGHETGADILLDVIRSAKDLGIKYMTLYVFSTENWQRNPTEVMALMWLFENFIRKNTPIMLEENVRFTTIGETAKFPEGVRNAIDEARDATKTCDAMQLLFAMNYGSRDELKRAIVQIAKDVKSERIQPDDIDETLISRTLDTGDIPDPDLLIRTGGEKRVSNFLLWQLSYSELYMTETLWPDFTPTSLFKAVLDYQQRKRRLGI